MFDLDKPFSINYSLVYKEAIMKTNVLVTGGAGFIGSHVAKWLVKAGYRVVVLDDLSGGFTENIPDGAEFVQGSVQDAALVDDLFAKEKFSYVFHLAAYAAEGLSHFIKNFNYQNNLVGSVNLINASVNSGTVKCFVFTSSIAVYGRNQTPMTEDLVPLPEDSYGISKYAVELDLKESKEMFGLDYVIFRPHNVYGEHQNIGDPYRNVIGIFMRQILTGKPLTIFGDGEQVRAFSYIDDVAPIIAACIERPDTWNQIYNIGADRPWTVNELADLALADGVPTATVLHSDLRATPETLPIYFAGDLLSGGWSFLTNAPFADGVVTLPPPDSTGYYAIGDPTAE